MGTVVAERIIDVALVAILVSIAVVWLVASGTGTSWLFVLVAFAMLALAVVALTGLRVLRPWLQRVLPRRLAGVFDRFYQGTVGSFRQMPFVVILGLLGWLSEVGRLYFVSQSLGVSLPMPTVIFVTLANAMLTLAPFTPGGLGIVEPGVVGLLVLSVSRTDAVSLALMDRSISYLSVIVAGALLFIARQVWKRRRASAR
jgi:uncharacterized protein (TIRG00374 family)